MTTESPTGRVIASVEVTEMGGPLYGDAELGDAVRHGIDKVKARIADGVPIPGEHHVTIVVEFRKPRAHKGGTQEIGRDGERTRRTRDGRVISEGNL